MYKALLVRFGEISLKGKNRSFFVNKLVENIKGALRESGAYQIEKSYGRIYLYIEGNPELYIEKLKLIPGIVSISPVAIIEPEIEKIKEMALKVFDYSVKEYPATFKVETSRPNKEFPLQSPEISREVGAHLLRNINTRRPEQLKVDVHNPEHLLSLEIRRDKALVYTESIPGIGGLPVGTSGKGLLLLSGGIDSPVAGWLSLKRGMTLDAIYFHSFPYTSDRAREKVLDLTRILSKYGGKINLFINHFTDIQMEIRKKCPPKYTITIMRRMMFRIAEEVARKNKNLVLVTGESIGQVASQTLESMHVINEVTNLPVLRPLISMDKTEIIQIARKIGSYNTSILPYEDCCSIFVPKHPVTRPTLKDTLEAEKDLEIERLIAESMEKSETVIIG